MIIKVEKILQETRTIIIIEIIIIKKKITEKILQETQ